MAHILITRAPHQASALVARLRALGHEPILIPTIEIADPSTFAPLDAALTRLAAPGPKNFHWLLFTSANAVDALKAHAKIDVSTLEHKIKQHKYAIKIASIGPATTHALQQIGLKPDLIPPYATAESLAESLLPHALQPDGTPTRMLFICSEIAREALPETLRTAGAEVTVSPAYTTRIPTESVPKLKSLFATPENYPFAILFTSSSTASNLFTMLNLAGLALPPEVPRISIGPVTSQTLREAGFSPHAEAAEPTLDGLIAALSPLLSAHPAQD